jgi:hypothetical protein
MSKTLNLILGWLVGSRDDGPLMEGEQSSGRLVDVPVCIETYVSLEEVEDV